MGRTLKSGKGKLLAGAKWLGVACVCAAVTSCTSTETATVKPKPKSKEYFAESEYGVKASPRVVGDGRAVPKGGGRFMVGNPYEVKGKTYVPKEDPKYNRSGLASWYGSAFHGRLTANGEVYDSAHISAAHPTFPLPSYARVTNLNTGSSVIVRVNDRGPFHPGRIIDVSSKAAELLDFKRTGTANVNVQYVGRARMDGRDMPFLMASYVRKGDRLPGIQPDGQIASGVMVASNQSLGDQLQTYGGNLPTPTAFAGATPSGPRAKAPSAAFAAASQAATIEAPAGDLPSTGPLPFNRPSGATVASVQVASFPAVPSAPVAAAPKRRAAAIAPAVSEHPAPQPRAARTAQPRPAAAAPAPARVEAAYSAPAPKSQEPRVIFGDVVLRGDGSMEHVPTPGLGKSGRP